MTITTSSSEANVIIHVSDSGHGIPEIIQDKLFDPFFTTKDNGSGTGLGLALTWNIIQEHAGSVQVVSPVDQEQQKGTRFVITLPKFVTQKEKDSTHSMSALQGLSLIHI